MDKSRWQKTESLYHAALHKPPGERKKFLAEECRGDKALYDDVASLLSSHDKSGQFLAEPDYELGLKILSQSVCVLKNDQILGNYKIIKLLGRGGMGEVYLARDQSLGRPVALKVLPGDVGSDVGRVRRFMQEARAASSLNHPNILTIYEIGEADGIGFIASEFVEGESLRQKLKRESSIRLPEIREIALQICAALNAAHRAGIVHRDIKPENLMIREDKLVKVLDFGLAKLVENLHEDFSAGDFLTTGQEMLMGTVAYMSPEQARGQKTDARSDIWSCGVVLYEMLTGKPPFTGETASDTIAAVLAAEHSPIDENFDEVIRQAIEKSLRKNPAERFQTTVEMAEDLKKLPLEADESSRPTTELSRNLSTSAINVSTADGIAPAQTSSFPIARSKTLVAAAAVFLITAGFFAFYHFASNSVFSTREPAALTRIADTGKTVTAAVSPDGKYVVHAVADGGQQSIWIKELATNGNTQIVAPKSVDYPAMTFSNDGNFVYYAQHDGELYQVSVLGGEPKKLPPRVNSAISFSPDGQRFAFMRNLPFDETALLIANADGSGERVIATRTKPEFFVGPAWSPDGKTIACSVGNQSGAPSAKIVEISVEEGAERIIPMQKWRAIWQVAWLSDGSGLIAPAISDAGGNDLLQIWFFPASGGEARRITNDLNNYGNVSLTADSNKLVTIRFEQRTNIWSLPQGKSEAARLVSNNVQALYRFVARMPDGRIIYPSEENSTGGGRHLWVMNADGSGARQLTAGAGDNILPCATPDGRYIVFASNRADLKNYHLWRINADGTDPVQLTNGDGERGPACSPDGKTIFYSSGGPDAGIDKSRLWKISIDGGEPSQITDYPAGWKDVSPDGEFVAVRFKADAASPVKLGVITADGGQPVKVFDLKENTQIRWKPDGQAITYIKNEKDVSNIWEQPISGEPPRPLTRFTAETIYFFDWSKDGDLICTRGYQARDPVLISNFK